MDTKSSMLSRFTSRWAAKRIFRKGGNQKPFTHFTKTKKSYCTTSETPPPYQGISPGRVVALVGLSLGAVLAFESINVVPAGHIGLRDLFGKVDEKILPSGLYFVNPLAKVVKFSIKTQNLSADVEVPSKEGLNLHLKLSALYRLEPSKVREIYITIGTNYSEVVLIPHFLSSIRQVTSGYEAKALYTAQTRGEMTEKIAEELTSLVKPRGIFIEDTPLREIVLPQKLTTSIEEKLSAEQESQRMEFVLQKERLEAERKAIEATGIAEFQRIVSTGVSEQLLKWKGIEATERLALSQNTKIVVIGGDDGLPIILNSSK